MTTSIDSVTTLSEQELLEHFIRLVVRDRRATAELLVAIAEIDERKIWAKHACSSMFTFCMERFHMSEQMTAKRLWAARTARRFPIVLGMVERGELHLGAIHLLAKHLNEENHIDVLERAKHKSCRDVERLVAEIAPRADVASRVRALPRPRGESVRGDATEAASSEPAECDWIAGDRHHRPSDDSGVVSPGDPEELLSRATARSSVQPATSRATNPIVPLSPRRYKIEITVDEATHDKLRSLQDLLGRSGTGRDPAAIISRAIDVLLVRTLARRAGCTDQPRSPEPAPDALKSQGARTRRSARPADATASNRATVLPSADAAASQRGEATRAVPTADGSRAAHRTRTIPASVRREVWRRDCGRCCYVDSMGRRCRATSNIEFHHRKPFATGGAPTTLNIELRCAAHNQYQADLDFGRSFMDDRRSKDAIYASFRGKCGKRPRSAGTTRT